MAPGAGAAAGGGELDAPAELAVPLGVGPLLGGAGAGQSSERRVGQRGERRGYVAAGDDAAPVVVPPEGVVERTSRSVEPSGRGEPIERLGHRQRGVSGVPRRHALPRADQGMRVEQRCGEECDDHDDDGPPCRQHPRSLTGRRMLDLVDEVLVARALGRLGHGRSPRT